MENKLTDSLVEALSYCHLSELPPEDNNEFIWAKSLALVGKSDGSFSYVLMVKDRNGGNKIIKDFGTISAIVEVKRIYPIVVLDERFIPVFDGRGKEERLSWLRRRGVKDIEGLTTKELDKMIINEATQDALRAYK